MAQIDRDTLKALWIDGFIPDQDDYADFFDSFLAFDEGANGASNINFDRYRYLEGVANDFSDLQTRITAVGGYPYYFVVKTVNNSTYFVMPEGANEIKDANRCRMVFFSNSGNVKSYPLDLADDQIANYVIRNISGTGISSPTFTDETDYDLSFWRQNPTPEIARQAQTGTYFSGTMSTSIAMGQADLVEPFTTQNDGYYTIIDKIVADVEVLQAFPSATLQTLNFYKNTSASPGQILGSITFDPQDVRRQIYTLIPGAQLFNPANPQNRVAVAFGNTNNGGSVRITCTIFYKRIKS